MSQPQHITINNKTYNVSDLSETAIGIVNNIQMTENAINDAQSKIYMFDLAKNSLIANLVEETKDLQEAVVATEEPVQA